MTKSRKRADRLKDNRISIDHLYLNMTRYMVRDFQTMFDDPTLYQDVARNCITGNISGLRASKPELDFESTPLKFKADYQIASLDKRYRYRKDIYSDNELKALAVSKFCDVQDRLGALDWVTLRQDLDLKRVLSLARQYCSHVLGDFDDDLCHNKAQFGSGASVGVKAREAHLAQRFVIPITGSKEQISWWRSEYDSCPHFQQWLESMYGITDTSDPRIYKEVDTLALTFVPKNHKSLRAILPNTTIGTYQSRGVGEIIRDRLKAVSRLDIRKLQHIHRVCAWSSSIGRRHVTMDLSSASDSISEGLLETLLPADWFSFLKGNRIGTVVVDGNVIQSNTFCTMGIGYTFELQTLVFLSLIWACQATNDKFMRPTWISVYGDDLIFGSHLDSQVRDVFGKVGICVNEDKTFNEVPFRESCGGDYYRGWDVRPFQPEMDRNFVTPLEYEAMLYKCINGLLIRWDEHAVWNTIRFLTNEIEKVAQACLLVPLTHPEDSGIRTGIDRAGHYTHDFLGYTKVVKPVHIGHGLRRFTCLKMNLQEKEEMRHGPYYWSTLRQRPLVRSDEHYRTDLCDRPLAFLSLRELTRKGYLHTREGEPYLISRKVHNKQLNPLKNSSAGSRPSDIVEPDEDETKTFVRIAHTGRYRRQRGLSCFETRS